MEYEVDFLVDGNPICTARVRNCRSASGARRLALANITTVVRAIGVKDKPVVAFNGHQGDLLLPEARPDPDFNNGEEN